MKKYVYLLIACIMIVLISGCLFHTIKDKNGIDKYVIGFVYDTMEEIADDISDTTGIPSWIVTGGLGLLTTALGVGTVKGAKHKKERKKLGVAYQEAEETGNFSGILKKHGVKDEKFFKKYIAPEKEKINAGTKV